MVELVVAQRYGKALFELALENNQIDEMEADVLFLKNTFKNEKDFKELLSNPQIPINERRKMLNEIFSGRILDDLIGLMDITIQKKRQDILPQIFDDFLSKVNKHKGILIVHATVYNQLTKDQEKALISKLQNVTKKSIQLNQNVDKSLIGGLVLRIGDRIINNSVKGMMEELSKELLSNRVNGWFGYYENYEKGGVTFAWT